MICNRISLHLQRMGFLFAAVMALRALPAWSQEARQPAPPPAAERPAVLEVEGAPRAQPAAPAPAEAEIHVEADPGNLVSYRDKVAQRFYFEVTGTTEGSVWGNVMYTDDSHLAATAVHAGVLSPGQRGVVKVTILPGRDSYAGTSSNGVQSQSYQEWPGSYSVERAKPRESGAPGAATPYPAVMPAPAVSTTAPAAKADSAPFDPASAVGSLPQHRDRVGQSFETDLVGSTQGRVWGTDVYSDDSSPAAAAVHAGVLRDGESGRVKITILAGQDSYQGSERNGVSSQTWQAWGGSFRIEKAAKPPQDGVRNQQS